MNATRKQAAVLSAHKSATALSPVQIADKYRTRCYRSGKTLRDHKNGNPKRAHERRHARAEWQKETRGRAYQSLEQVPKFPV